MKKKREMRRDEKEGSGITGIMNGCRRVINCAERKGMSG
jgi:hypothetical protein